MARRSVPGACDRSVTVNPKTAGAVELSGGGLVMYIKSEIIGRGKEMVMSGRLKRVMGSGNIFRDVGFSREEAENLKLRSELMMKIDDFYRQSGLTQSGAAKVLGLTQPRLNALLKGKIQLFSLDSLVNVAGRAGLTIRLVVKKAA